jgi:hypothetical protein
MQYSFCRSAKFTNTVRTTVYLRLIHRFVAEIYDARGQNFSLVERNVKWLTKNHVSALIIDGWKYSLKIIC